jgi:uncharacterized lipoprotein NlpE involved in copper resistance
MSLKVVNLHKLNSNDMKRIIKWELMLMVLVFVGCRNISVENEPTADANATKTDLLSGKMTKSWNLVSNKVNGRDVLDGMPDCVKDDVLTFNADQTYELNEGPSKCKDRYQQIIRKGTWLFKNADTEVFFDNNDTFKILEINSLSLKITYKNVFGETEERTYKAKL